MEGKKVIIDGIIKSKAGGYSFGIITEEIEDAQYFKDIIRQVFEQSGLMVDIQTCMYDSEEVKNVL